MNHDEKTRELLQRATKSLEWMTEDMVRRVNHYGIQAPQYGIQAQPYTIQAHSHGIQAHQYMKLKEAMSLLSELQGLSQRLAMDDAYRGIT